jgi:hypothetical protein
MSTSVAVDSSDESITAAEAAKLARLHRPGRIVPLPRWGIRTASGVGAIRGVSRRNPCAVERSGLPAPRAGDHGHEVGAYVFACLVEVFEFDRGVGCDHEGQGEAGL